MRTTTPSIADPDCPAFLQQPADKAFRDKIERAYVRYLQETKTTPEEGSKKKPKMKLLLPYLQEIDPRWREIEREEMVGTAPRKLVHQMNTHLCKWVQDMEKVQQ